MSSTNSTSKPRKRDLEFSDSPTPEDRSSAARSRRQVERLIEITSHTSVDLKAPGGETVSLPYAAMPLLIKVLREMEQGNAVTILPSHAELTTQGAADFLNVSRPYLVELLESGAIPFHKIGTHRRVYLKDLQEYKDKVDGDRRKVLEELAAQAQELNMGY